MRVFKFGGASVRSVKEIKNVVSIIAKHHVEIVVVSAMGKMTNAFEELVEAYVKSEDAWKERYQYIADYHLDIVKDLFVEGHRGRNAIEDILFTLKDILNRNSSAQYPEVYDQIVPFGEILSTTILYHQLQEEEIDYQWLDAREWLRTDQVFGEANVDFQATAEKLKSMLKPDSYYITQGFIGGYDAGFSTTLGREGSDYTAAIMAYLVNAESVTIWKDVPGLLNADPSEFADTVKLPNISYKEAVELAFFGAKVIHPKTIKPLQNKAIPLYVRSFVDINDPGTIIDKETSWDKDVTSYILKKNQVLLTLRTCDFSFMAEHHIHHLYGIFDQNRIKINIMQQSAITLSVCMDADEEKLDALLKMLSNDYEVKYNKGLELITLRHYTEEAIRNVSNGRKVLLEQRSRATAQVVMG